MALSMLKSFSLVHFNFIPDVNSFLGLQKRQVKNLAMEELNSGSPVESVALMVLSRLIINY